VGVYVDHGLKYQPPFLTLTRLGAIPILVNSRFFCSNMAFAGDFAPVLAKHSKSFSLVDCISVGADRKRNLPAVQLFGNAPPPTSRFQASSTPQQGCPRHCPIAESLPRSE
jgi:hypothetical protein